MHVSKRLMEWRLAAGLNQRQAAELAKVTQAAWSKYENGHARPKQRAADNIERLTKKRIRASDWAETDEERARRLERTRAHTVSAPEVAKAS